MLIKASEKDGNYGLRPHSALGGTTKITGIKVNNMISILQIAGYHKKLEIELDSNMTVFDVKNKILKDLFASADIKEVTAKTPKAPIHASKIIITKNQALKPIPDFDNGTTMDELKLKSGDIFNVQMRPDSVSSTVPLFNDEITDINDRTKFIFDQMFNTFAVAEADQMVIGRD